MDCTSVGMLSELCCMFDSSAELVHNQVNRTVLTRGFGTLLWCSGRVISAHVLLTHVPLQKLNTVIT